jgi:hypothetical protein
MARVTEFTVSALEPEGGANPKRGATERKAKHQPRRTLRFVEQSLEVGLTGCGSYPRR